MTVDHVLEIYDRALNQDDGCARWAFTCAIHSLIGEWWSWQVPPHVLTSRASTLVSLRRDRSPAHQEVIERSILALFDRLQRDLILYVYDGVDQLTCTWSEYARDNAGDLECELALSKLWAGSWWAPVGRDTMLSLNPLEVSSHAPH